MSIYTECLRFVFMNNTPATLLPQILHTIIHVRFSSFINKRINIVVKRT